MKYYTSDLHLNHRNILLYENRPFRSVEEMNEALIENWNRCVKQNDEVYILGDFCFDNSGELANRFLKRLNGKKYLIIGNHDSFLKAKAFDKSAFEWIRHYAEIHDEGHSVILFHYPIAVWNKKHHNSIHLYGHIHSNTQDHHPMTYALGNAFNVGVDVCDFEPKTLKEIINMNGGLCDTEK